MPNIDDKVVAMSFDNSKFESGVKTTLGSLDKLKSSLQFPNAGKGLDNINAAAKRVNLSSIANDVDTIKNKLGYLSVAALAIFANIAARAVQAGAQMVKAFTIGPIIQGMDIYKTKLQAIQTIMANTQAAGTKMKDVTKALNELNVYSNKTIYAFGEMTRNIGTFTAAGVALKPAVASIKGIANLAALSGSNSQQAATAMYQLSQAIGAGRVSLQDWNSVVNAGMGGTVFQRALAQTAVAMGQLPKSALKLVGPMKNVSIHGMSFRQSMQATPGHQSWLTSDVLVKTLATFTGDLTDAQLAAEGFTKAQIKSIQAQAKIAVNAATQVKTFSQLMDVLKESVATGWSQSFEIIIGNLNEAKKLFTGISNSIGGVISASAKARNKMLGDWKKLGGRTELIDAFKNAFSALGLVVDQFKNSFREFFPRTTGKQLFDLTKRFNEFTKSLKPSFKTLYNLHMTFRGIFAILDIGRMVIGGFLKVFANLFGMVFRGSGGFLEITSKIGQFLVGLDLAIRKGKGLETFFGGLTAVLAIPIKLFQAITDAIANMFSGFSPGGFSVQMDSATKATEPFKKVLEVISQSLEGLGPAINKAIQNMNFEAILQVIRTGLFAALVLMIRKFVKGTTLERTLAVFGSRLGGSFAKNLGGGILGNLGKSFGSLTGSLQAMQSNLKAQTLEKIAIAIALLSASVVALSLVNPKRLNASLGAMAIMFGELIGALMIMDKVLKTTGALKLTLISVALIGLATAIDLLTIAVFTMSKLSWSELTKGLGGIVVLLGALSKASASLAENSAGMIRAGVAIGVIAVALNIMALAVRQLGSLDLGSLIKGLGGIAGVLYILVRAMKEMPKGMIQQSAALIIIATALNILARAVRQFGTMNLSTLAKGLLGIGAGLYIIVRAMKIMPTSKGLIASAAGLFIVASSLGMVADAVVKMGAMSLAELGKGIVGLAGALIVLAGALHDMSGTLVGAAALTVAAIGVKMFVSALIPLGQQSIGSIIKSLVSLAAGMGILAGAALLLQEAIPALLGFGAALVLIGGGIALAGAGVALIGVGLSAIAVSGQVATAILIQAFTDLTKAVPEMAKNLVLGLLEIVKAFANTAPQFVDAMVKILDSVAEAITKSAPKLMEALVVLITEALQALAGHAPEIVQAGIDILMALLKGISQNIEQIVTVAATIVVKFITSLAKNMYRIITAGFTFVIKLVEGITNNIDRLITAGANIITKFITGIGNNIVSVVNAGAHVIVKMAEGLGKNLVKIVNAGGTAIANFITGIGNNIKKVIRTGTDVAVQLVWAIVQQLLRLEKALALSTLVFLEGTARIIRKYTRRIVKAFIDVGLAIGQGIAQGIRDSRPEIRKTILNLGLDMLKSFSKGPLGPFFSPSHATMKIGRDVGLGLAVGISQNASSVHKAVFSIANGVIRVFNDTLQTASPSKVTKKIGKYVGQGFADGLVGSKADVNNAFSSLKDMISSNITTIRQKIEKEKKKLQELQKSPQENAKAIKATQNALKEDQATLKALTSTQKLLTGSLKGEKKELLGLANDYDNIGKKLSAAKQVLSQATQQRNEAFQTYKDQYSQLPDFVSGPEVLDSDLVTSYMTSLKNQIEAINKYKITLNKLRKLGLDNTTYKKLLDEGTIDQQFASRLLAGGKTAVKNLNNLDSRLMKSAGAMANSGARNLYQAGVDVASGIVKGLESQQARIAKTMAGIAGTLVTSIKKKLGIKSPSREFAEIARLSIQGMIDGFTSSSKQLTSSVDQVANSALTAMRNSIGKYSFADLIDMEPTITPVMDLSSVQKGADQLTNMINKTPLGTVSLDQASVISAKQIELQADQTVPAPSSETSIRFEQNNYSPRELSSVEVYRQTRNQLSQLRSIAVPV